ncbi:unnamed protein product [Rotaria sp. Silwood1]|nr:unnamed protein product [Rotaria sp. Silwood1]CAF4618459.1 unnamed protein product [Rotaria sp. Silwood1]
MSDEARLGTDNSGQAALEYRYQIGSAEGAINSTWSGYYTAIHQINTVLPYFDKISGDANRKKEMQGQLLALRAICHLNLLQSYSGRYNPSALGVPLITAVDILAKPKRNTMGEVMKGIEDDFTSANTLLSTSTKFSDTTINYLNLMAFRAEAALYKEDYSSAVSYCNSLLSNTNLPANTKNIANGTGPLTGTAKPYADIWTDIYNADGNLNEMLFRIRYATSGTMGGLFTTTTNDVYFAPSDKLLASFPTANAPAAGSDVRKSLFIGTVAGKRFVNKYKGSSRGGLVLDMKWLRISEIYLMRAEALAKQSSADLTGASADLNLLRSKRINGYTNQTFSSASDLMDAVVLERYKELCFEGDRFFDLKRYNLPVNRLGSDANTAWQNLPVNDYRFLIPVPNEELLANPNMIQNPGY